MAGAGRSLSCRVRWGSDPDITALQYQCLANQIPHLYVILAINAVLLAATHVRTAPSLLTVYVPIVFVLVSLLRVSQWFGRRHEVVDGALASAQLRRMTWLAGIFSLVVTSWSLALTPYGDAFARCHVAFYMAITVISCLFCLRHAPLAALIVTCAVVIPFAIFFMTIGPLVLRMLAVNLVMVTASVMMALRSQFADFVSLQQSRRELLDRQDRLEQLNSENQTLANLDSLTGMPNRRRFLSVLDECLLNAQKDGTRFAVALFDLDGFKSVNDVYGHQAGDRLLAEAGQRMLDLRLASVTFARLGGDEFGAVLRGDPTEDEMRSFGALLCETVRGRYLGPEMPAEVTCSAGIVNFPEGGTTAEQLFERADYALYYAKQNSRGSLVMFSGEHERMIREAGLLDHALRQVDVKAEMELAFQPISDVVADRIVGFEALARWTSPRLGPVSPDRFIAAAERMHVIGRISEILLAKALEAAREWDPDIRIAFNFSALDLTTPSTLDAIIKVIGESGVDPRRIDLEVTETAVMREIDKAISALERVRKLGVHISLDDFGTGYSSLSYVHRLKPDKIKIDRSFVSEILTSQQSRDIIRTTIELCRSLDLVCIVEGVETEAQVNVLRRLGCRMMQGYHFGRPMAAADLAGLLRRPAAVA